VNAPRSVREWLKDELPGLVQNEVLDAAAAERLGRHYQLEALGDRSAARRLILALLGCCLVGAGVILLFAHNWDELSRPLRAAVSLGQLAVAQAIAAYAMTRKPPSTAALESTGALLALSIGAAIALISQTYHLDGELGDFMLAWIVLAAPLLYVLPARIVATLVLLAAPWLAFERLREPDHGFLYCVAIAAVLPALELREHANRSAGLTLLARWAFVLTVPLAAAPLVVDRHGGPWLPLYAGLAASFTALGVILERGASFPRRAFSIAGGVGTVLLTLVLSYRDAIGQVLSNHPPDYATRSTWPGMAAFGVALLAIGIAAALAPQVIRARDHAALTLLGMNTALIAIYGLVYARVSLDALAVVVSVLLLLTGGELLALGLRAHSASLSNKGLAVLAILFVARFFDTELSFIVRGLGFVLLGVAFLVVNIMLSKRAAGSTP
jgi:hypothetical protein